MLRYFHNDVVLFAVMITVECTNVGVRVLFKVATDRGLSYYVNIVYSYLISTLLLILPLPFIFSRYFPLISLMFMLMNWVPFEVVRALQNFPPRSVVAMLCGYRGLWYSSPTVASAASNSDQRLPSYLPSF